MERTLPISTNPLLSPNESNAYASASLFQKAFFTWIHPIIQKGQKTYLQKSMLFPVPESFSAEILMCRFSKKWALFNLHKSTVLRTLIRTFPKEIAIFFLLEVLGTILSFTNPMVIQQVIKYVSETNKETKTAIILIVLIFVSKMVGLLCSTVCVFLGNMLGMMVSSALSMKIFDKSLKFPLLGSREYSEGKLVNMLQTDLENISQIFFNLFSMFILPLQLLVGLILMYFSVNIAFLAGLVVVLLMGLLNFLIGKLYLGYQKQLMIARDERIKGSNELLNRIFNIKLNAEENCSYAKLKALRKNELVLLIKQRVLDVSYILVFWITPVLVIIFTFLVSIMLGKDISALEAFTVLSLFQTLSGSLNGMPYAIAALINSMISIRRVDEFFAQREIDPLFSDGDANDKRALVLKNGTFYWNKGKDDQKARLPINPDQSSQVRINVNGDSSVFNTVLFPENLAGIRPNLTNIELNIKKGAFVAIVGTIGSGKSSLIQSFLNEMMVDEGAKAFSREINGSLAYTSQKAWIQNLTIRDNITFGLQFDRDRYSLVKKLVCLDEDLKTLKHGDETMIGDKGINVSGGQKARINLARALYANRDIYLLDDILAGLDPNVSKTIFTECFLKFLRSKTRVLCTHNLNYLEFVDYIYVLSGGKVIEEGSFDRVRSSPFLSLSDPLKEKQPAHPHFKELVPQIGNVSTSEGVSASSWGNSNLNLEEESPLLRWKAEQSSGGNMKKIVDDLILDEDRHLGHVSFGVVKSYIQYNGGLFFSFVLILIMLVWMGLEFASNFWLEYWTSTNDSAHDLFYLKIYAVFSVSYAVAAATKDSVLFAGNYICSMKVHNQIMGALLLAPMNEFFDRIPIGRLLNRLSKDLYMIDTQISINLGVFLVSVFSLIESFGLCFYAIKYWILIPFFFMTVFLVKIQQIYMKCNRELVRLEAISKSPIVSFFTETLAGLTTIRAFSQTDAFMKRHAENLNENIRTLIMKYAFEQWFTQRMTLVSLILVMTVSCITLFCSFTPGFAGLLLIYVFQIEGSLRYTVSSLSYIECQLISFERCHSLTRVAPEDGYVSHDLELAKPFSQPQNEWPSHGAIVFSNVDLRYRANLNDVLKNMSFMIRPGEKVGIVGRTGSGKSTIFRCLLRLVENYNGKVTVDGIDIKSLDLRDLRKRITLIPQESYFFEGTLRANLDPHGEYTDGFIWECLENVGLGEALKGKKGLGTEVKEMGTNLSDGEKQMISLSRAFLQRNRIVLIDEVMDTINKTSEREVRRIIKEKMKELTVLIIAHRIRNVVDLDRVMVVEKGEIVEFEEPGVLMERKDSVFYRMWQDSRNLV